jgi:hypothetical protein
MAHDPEHTIEHASHENGSHDPFDRRVAMTMVIVAALLAAVKVLGHRAHNDTLHYQILAGISHTKASDQWAYFQAKKQRQYLYDSEARLLAVTAKDAGNPSSASDAAKLAADWQKNAQRYEGETKEIEQEARKLEKEAEGYQEKSAAAHHRSDRFDLGELGVELALVLLSVAILTKQQTFWYVGIAVGLAGAGVAVSGLFLR